MTMNLEQLVRPNIWKLAPYSSARDEYSGKEAHVFLDANENPYGVPYNRYPDPLQRELKKQISKVKGIPEDMIFLGNGSDEAIDLPYRVFCEPGSDNVVAIEPTYGMYKVCADINNVEYRPVLLDEQFDFKADDLLKACDSHTKLIWLCSPNNPTGNSLNREEIIKVIESFEGIVIVDEAYNDFAQQKTLRAELAKYPNLIILNTMSKAWALAGIRLGMAFASKEIVYIYNKVKYPYNIDEAAMQLAIERLAHPVEHRVAEIKAQRRVVADALARLPMVQRVYPSEANFLLVRFDDPEAVYARLIREGIIVRNRSGVRGCEGCLRITIGREEENRKLLESLNRYEK